MKPNFSESDLEKIKKLYLEDKVSTAKIGMLYNTSATTICFHLRKNGVKLRTRGSLKKLNTDDVISFVNANPPKRLADLAEHFGVSIITLRNILKKNIDRINTAIQFRRFRILLERWKNGKRQNKQPEV